MQTMNQIIELGRSLHREISQSQGLSREEIEKILWKDMKRNTSSYIFPKGKIPLKFLEVNSN